MRLACPLRAHLWFLFESGSKMRAERMGAEGKVGGKVGGGGLGSGEEKEGGEGREGRKWGRKGMGGEDREEATGQGDREEMEGEGKGGVERAGGQAGRAGKLF